MTGDVCFSENVETAREFLCLVLLDRREKSRKTMTPWKIEDELN